MIMMPIQLYIICLSITHGDLAGVAVHWSQSCIPMKTSADDRSHVWWLVTYMIWLHFGENGTQDSKQHNYSWMPFSTGRGRLMSHACEETSQTSLRYQRRCNTSRKSTVETDISIHKIMNQVNMDYSMTIKEWVEQVKPTEVTIITVLMTIRNTIHPMLGTIQALLQVPVWDHVLLITRCTTGAQWNCHPYSISLPPKWQSPSNCGHDDGIMPTSIHELYHKNPD